VIRPEQIIGLQFRQMDAHLIRQQTSLSQA
jgi:hypothetical protein